jgi:hypothetical protein
VDSSHSRQEPSIPSYQAIDFYMLISYPASLPKVFIRSKKFLVEFLGLLDKYITYK